ncbi:MAG: hypothetical protein L6R38_002788 [Xanthoria sp. 2 TBL-2021]|nr:MAG: hypothetical protein L6R38_002788 [Xanthoria sp. 2 TBL-2021]
MRFATICTVLSLLAAPLAIIAAPAPAPAAVANPEPHGRGYGKDRGGHGHGGYDKDEVEDETDDQGEFWGGAAATGTFTGFGAVPTGGNDDNDFIGGNGPLPSSIVGGSVPTPVAGAGADEDGEAVDEATTTTSSTRSTATD